MTISDQIKAVQSQLGLETDGLAGPITWGAIYKKIVPESNQPSTDPSDAVDERSEKNIATLQEAVRPYARALVQGAKERGIEIKVISGTRTYAEQDELYAKGRTKPGSIVTNARAGYSNHNHGIAFDIGIFEDGKYIPESPLYKVVGLIGKSLGLEWGGSWRTIVDEPHFQLRPAWAKDLAERDMLAALREGRKAFV